MTNFAARAATALMTLPFSLGMCTSLSGPTDENFLHRFNALKDQSHIEVSSTGGSPVYAFEVGKQMDRVGTTLSVNDLCLSACAEYVLPFAKSVEVEETALIGFHGNDFISEWIRNTYHPSQDPMCGQDRLEYSRELFYRKGYNSEFWREIAKRLRIADSEASMRGDCASVAIYSEIDMWFPTAAQMKELFGLDLGARLCADSESCWRRKMTRVINPGKSFVVGDDIYTMVSRGTIVHQPNFRSRRSILLPDSKSMDNS